MLKNLVHTRYMRADMVYEKDTVRDIGLRLRGNTSLKHKKKSFKISFNEFVPERTYQGVKKLNLRGSANDPTMVREKLFYEIWEKAEMPQRGAAFAQLYINKEYMGLYTNMEEIDKGWLERTYGNNEGNLYKCTWPADLAYLGDDQEAYKKIMNNPLERAYDLVTNEQEDNYKRFVLLLKTLNQPVDEAFADKINAILNVQSVLKSYAIDVATGNWDDYFYNKNNFYLYDNPVTGKFDFFTFDTDNSLGIDWVNRDWTKRDLIAWHRTGEPRPLVTQLLEVPAFKEQYLRYLDEITERITHPDVIFPRINELRHQLTAAATTDTYRSLDYGYDLSDFYNGFEKTVDTHTPYGIKPFLVARYVNTRNQLATHLSLTSAGNHLQAQATVRVFPNPFCDQVSVQWSEQQGNATSVHITLYDTQGCVRQSWDIPDGQLQNAPISTTALPVGTYFLKWQSGPHSGQTILHKQ